MLPSMNSARLVLLLLYTPLIGCTGHGMEKAFFQQPLQTRVERLRQYSLEDQYRIFRYGNDVVHPPLTNLAVPIAERGSGAIPFLKSRLETEHDDFSIRDILRIIEEMKWSKSYDVKGDEALIRILKSMVDGMRDKEWQSICTKMLNAIATN